MEAHSHLRCCEYKCTVTQLTVMFQIRNNFSLCVINCLPCCKMCQVNVLDIHEAFVLGYVQIVCVMSHC